MTDFIARNDGEITNQIQRLASIVTNLKAVVKENGELEKDKEEYNEIMNSDMSFDIVDKLNELKKSTLLFLENSGITLTGLH